MLHRPAFSGLKGWAKNSSMSARVVLSKLDIQDKADMATETASVVDSAVKSTKPLGMRKNGKQWHEPKKAFRPTAGLTSYEKRTKERAAMAQMKAKEKEMKADKEAQRQQRIEAIRDKRARKEEKERYEKMAETMHRKRVERLKRKEKRNKLLNS